RLCLLLSAACMCGVWLLLLFVWVLRDVWQQEQQQQGAAAAAAAACRQQHRENRCETLKPLPPFLAAPCEEWRRCFLSKPSSHGQTAAVAAQVLARVLNAFVLTLHWRTLLAVVAFLWLSIYGFKAVYNALGVSAPQQQQQQQLQQLQQQQLLLQQQQLCAAYP
ncbi:hypothetical protein, conserved, partial [Eimeria tenella]